MGRQNERNRRPSRDSLGGQEPEREPEGESGKGGGGLESNGEERGGDGWLVGVRMCVRGTTFMCVCVTASIAEFKYVFSCKNKLARTHNVLRQVEPGCFRLFSGNRSWKRIVVALKAEGGKLMEEEGGAESDDLGPDPAVLPASLGKQAVLSGFFRHGPGHQTVSQTRAAVDSELPDGS